MLEHVFLSLWAVLILLNQLFDGWLQKDNVLIKGAAPRMLDGEAPIRITALTHLH